jgi:hypothetical protein
MGSTDRKSSRKQQHTPRKRGRPFKLPLIERVKWVGIADEAKRISLLLARMHELPPDERKSLSKLPAELQLLVVLGAWGRHSRYLNAVALKSAMARPLDDELRSLVPRGNNPDRWTAEEKRKFARLVSELRKYRRQFGKHVDPRQPLGIAIHIDQPSYISHLWREIDQWIANHLDVSLSAFWSWRRQLVEDGLLMPRGRISPARRRAGLQLQKRLAQPTISKPSLRR